jgi:predicted DNA-binding protein YlxM (UPF0122 family)
MTDQQTRLLSFFAALSDASRLKIVGLLAQDDFSVEELAEMLQLRPSTVSHHLARLGKAGLVSARAESYYNVYRLDTEALALLAQSLLAQDALPNLAAGVDVNAYDRKVVADYARADGRLKTIPAQRKKLEAVLRHVVTAFESGTQYSEQQVNDTLAQFHADTATLRRELIAARMMERDPAGSQYWRVGG